MSLIHKFSDWLFSVPESDRSLRDMIVWWELRRIPYNLIIASVGFCSLLLFFIFIGASNELEPGDDAVEPLGLIAAPFVMNICYTSGWVVEALFGRVWSVDGETIAPRLLKFGLGLSLFIVILPSAVGVYTC